MIDIKLNKLCKKIEPARFKVRQASYKNNPQVGLFMNWPVLHMVNAGKYLIKPVEE